MKNRTLRFLAVAAASLIAAQSAWAGAVRLDAAFHATPLPANDDGSTGSVGFGFGHAVNFFGVSYSGGFVNNNGNLTFGSVMSTYTPFNIITTGKPILAPFFADVDTRGVGSGLLRYGGGGSVNGHAAWGASWDGVGYYGLHDDKLNKFQLIIIDRPDTGVGNFDFEFNYDQIQWETGDASGGVGGFGGTPARAGWANGILPPNPAAAAYEIPGAGVVGGYRIGANNLALRSNGSGELGRFLFEVRNGQVVPDAGSSLGLMGLAFVALAAVRRKLAG